MTWLAACLSDICEAIFDGPFGSHLKTADYTKAGTRVVRLENIGRLRFLTEGETFISDEKARSLSRHLLRPGDIIFSSFIDEAIRVCLMPDLGKPAINKADCFCIRVDPRVADSRFVVMRLASNATFEALSEVVHGATRPRIGLKDLKRYRLELPVLAEQTRIVARIQKLFARIRRARAELERVAPLARRYRDQVLISVFDRDWPEMPVGAVASAVFDGPFGSHLKSKDYTPSGTRVVRLENIGHLVFHTEKETFVSTEKGGELARHRLQVGDVLFASFIDKEVRVCLFPENLAIDAINKADCFCIRTDRDRCDPRFLAYRLASSRTYEDMRDAVHGATRPRIGLSDLKRYRVPIPSLAEQAAVVAKIDEAHRKAHRAEREAKRALALLDRLESAILARAFKGELVPQDCFEEPVSAALSHSESSTPASARARRPRAA